jgi:hypothetical protein
MTLKLRSVKRKGSSMAKEGAQQGIDDLLDDIPDEEVVEEQPVEGDSTAEASQEEAPQQETETPTEEVTESQVEKLFEKPEKPEYMQGKKVELEDHIKLRKRAQAAEAKLAELQAAQAPVDTGVLDEISALLDGDEEYAEKDALRKAFNKLPKVIAQIAQKTTSEALGNVQMQNIAAKAKADEAAFKKDNPDYDTIVGFAARHKLLSQDELKEVFTSGNIAETYYTKAKAAVQAERDALGIAPSKPTTEIDNPPDGPVDDAGFDNDDEAFDAFLTGGS